MDIWPICHFVKQHKIVFVKWKMSFDQMSVDQIFCWPNEYLKRCPVGKMSVIKMPEWPNVFWPNVCWSNVCHPNVFDQKTF